MEQGEDLTTIKLGAWSALRLVELKGNNGTWSVTGLSLTLALVHNMAAITDGKFQYIRSVVPKSVLHGSQGLSYQFPGDPWIHFCNECLEVYLFFNYRNNKIKKMFKFTFKTQRQCINISIVYTVVF